MISKADQRPPGAVAVLKNLRAERLRVDPQVADDERLEQEPEQVQVSEQPLGGRAQGGDGERRVDEVAFGGAAQDVFRTQMRGPGRLILDDQQALQRIEVVTHRIVLQVAAAYVATLRAGL